MMEVDKAAGGRLLPQQGLQAEPVQRDVHNDLVEPDLEQLEVDGETDHAEPLRAPGWVAFWAGAATTLIGLLALLVWFSWRTAIASEAQACLMKAQATSLGYPGSSVAFTETSRAFNKCGIVVERHETP